MSLYHILQNQLVENPSNHFMQIEAHSKEYTSNSKVGVALLNWNGGEFTIPCIESLLASEFSPWRIVVFDNASSDRSPDRIAATFPQVCVIRHDRNLGFAGGTNAAIRALMKDGADFIWVLNNDTLVDAKCLGTLVKAMCEDPTIGVTSSKILYETPPNLIWYAGATWNYWSMYSPHKGQGQTDEGQYNRPYDVGFVSGCCMLIRRNCFEQVGLLDERFFAYSEDADWCLRALKKGIRLRYLPESVMWHKVSASLKKNTLSPKSGSASPRFHFLSSRNRIFLIRKHSQRPIRFFVAMFMVIAESVYTSLGLIVLRRWDKLRSRWRGIWEGVFTTL